MGKTGGFVPPGGSVGTETPTGGRVANTGGVVGTADPLANGETVTGKETLGVASVDEPGLGGGVELIGGDVVPSPTDGKYVGSPEPPSGLPP